MAVALAASLHAAAHRCCHCRRLHDDHVGDASNWHRRAQEDTSKIFRDFFTFRPRRGQRSWLDLHNLVGVTALPFFVMITFSGLVFSPQAYMPAAAHARYGGDLRQLETDSSVWLKPEVRAGVPAPMLPLREVISEARRYWTDGRVGRISVFNPGDINARVRFDHEGDSTLQRGVLQVLYFDAVNGSLIHRYNPLQSAPRAVASALYGLHEGKFAGWTLRWLYFGSGLLGCGMVATGLVLWTVKRRAQHTNTDTADFGFRLVECLNIGTLAACRSVSPPTSGRIDSFQ